MFTTVKQIIRSPSKVPLEVPGTYAACVPPATMTFRPGSDRRPEEPAACGVIVPSWTSSSMLSALSTNFRMLTDQCLRVMSGMTTWQPRAVRQHGVHKRKAQVHPATGGL